jgi:hypothetical protein
MAKVEGSNPFIRFREHAAQEAVRLRRTLRGLGVFADVLVISEDEARAWRDVRGSLIHAALSEGRPPAA